MKTKNKKAISLMISYIILIAIAIGLSIGIYAWLKAYVSPGDVPECNEETSLIIKSYSCDDENKILSLNIENKGLFNIDGFFIKASKDLLKSPINPLTSNEPGNPTPGIYDFKNGTSTSSDYITLKPGENKTIGFRYFKIGAVEKIQIEPFIFFKNKTNKRTLCKDSVIVVKIEDCSVCPKGYEWIDDGCYILQTITLTGTGGYVYYYKKSYIKSNIFGTIGYKRDYYVLARAWARFDIRSIPDSATIKDVQFNWTINSYSTAPGIDFNNISLDPDSSDAKTIYVDTGSDFFNLPYAECGEGVCDSTGNKQVDLGTTADSELQGQLLNNWFAVGLAAHDEAKESWYRVSSPELKVTYSDLYSE